MPDYLVTLATRGKPKHTVFAPDAESARKYGETIGPVLNVERLAGGDEAYRELKTATKPKAQRRAG